MSISGITSTGATSLWELYQSGQNSGTESADAASALTGVGKSTSGVSEKSEASSGGSKVYDAMDTNQDGVVSMEELEQAMELQRAAQGTRARMAGQETPRAQQGGEAASMVGAYAQTGQARDGAAAVQRSV